MDYQQIMENVLNWTASLGALLMEGASLSQKEVAVKSSGIDLVTEYDIKCEKQLIAYIEENYPEHGIIGEENGSRREQADYVWTLDPVDGTTNFYKGLPFFAISIGLKYKGESILGVVHAPMLGYTFSALKGKGAYFNGEKMRVSSVDTLSSAVIGTGFPYSRKENNMNLPYFLKIVNEVAGIRRYGAASLDLCLVAAGKLDAYWEFCLKPWDVAAGAIILEEAGGKFEQIQIDGDVMTIASNNTLHQTLKNKLL